MERVHPGDSAHELRFGGRFRAYTDRKGTNVDLYQFFITYNHAWTVREAVCFAVLFLAVLTVCVILVRKRRIACSQAAALLLLLSFLAVVFGSTVFARQPGRHYTYELELFWSWKRVLAGSREMLKENLLNCLLLFPAGLLLPFIRRGRVAWWKGLCFGAGISVMIEVSQLVLRRGLFEWDDIIHNAFGCMLGAVLSSRILIPVLVYFRTEKKNADTDVQP